MAEIDQDFSDTWIDDRLGRASDAQFLRSFLLNRLTERKEANRPESYVLNIDASWGQGKSFFLSRFASMLRNDGFLVAEVNAWQDDHADDPLLSVMDAIDRAADPLIKREKRARERWNEVKRTGAAIAVAAARGPSVQIARRLIGDGIDEISTILSTPSSSELTKASDDLAKSLGDIIDEQGKVLLATFREGKRTIESFRKNLAKFLEEASLRKQRLPLFVFIDELDRCRPPFAIAMLERIKHLFDIDQVVFVVATDTTQLSHSVGAVYGGGFNSQGYLSRFFDRTYYFGRVSKSEFLDGLLTKTPLNESKLSLPPNVSLAQYLAEGFDFFGLPLRDIEHVYDILRSVVTAWDLPLQVETCVLFPVAVLHQQKISAPFDHNFSGILNQLHQKLGGVANWQVKFIAGRYSQSEESTSGVAIANDFIAHSTRGLHDLNHDVTAAHSRWVVQRLSEERNTSYAGRGTMSIIRRYPDIVRSAGRLSQSIASLRH
jgi:KAP family P-loop domain